MSSYNKVSAQNTKNAPEVIGLFSQTVAFSHYNHLSAQLPINPLTGKIVDGGIKEQSKQCFENIKAIVDSIDHVMNDVVRVNIFVKNIKDVDAVETIYKTYFTTYIPSKTVVSVTNLPMDALVQVEAVLSHGEGTIPNAPQSGDLIKLTNNTANAPLSNLSTQSVAFSHYTNITSQLPIDPKSGRIVEGGIKLQTAQCLRNVKSILESLDVPFDDIVKVTVYLSDLNDAEAVNQVYATFFPDSAIARAVAFTPARTLVAVKALPMGSLVQVEAVVSYGDGTPPQEVEDRHGLIMEANNTKKAPINPLSTQSVAFSHYNNISAQLPVDVATGKIVSGGVKEQAAQCLTNIKSILENVDHTIADVVKINIFLKNISDMDEAVKSCKTFFPNCPPAQRTIEVSELPLGALIQIDAVAGNEEGTPAIV